jgi:hypothetical protein
MTPTEFLYLTGQPRNCPMAVLRKLEAVLMCLFAAVIWGIVALQLWLIFVKEW